MLFRQCLKAVLQIDAIRRQHTAAYVEVQLSVAVDTAVDGAADRIYEALGEFLSRLSAPTGESIVFFPISGIDLRATELPFAGGIFRRFDAAETQPKVLAAIKRDLTVDDQKILDDINGVVGIELRVVADYQKALEVATLRVGWILAALTLLYTIEFGEPDRAIVTIQRPAWTATQPILLVSPETWQTVQTSWPDYPFNLLVNSGLPRLLRKHGLEDLIEVLASVDDERDDINLLIATSIYWYAVAIEARQPEVRLINFTIAGELFFSGDRRHVVSNFADGAAFLLAEADDREAQGNIRCQIEKLYDSRSRIAHAGERVTAEDVVAARRLVREIISAVLHRRNEFPDRQSLINWVRALRGAAAEPAG